MAAAAALAACLALPALAADCAALKEAKQRLECLAEAGRAKAAPATPSGQWTVEAGKDPISDVAVLAVALTGVYQRAGRLRPPVLVGRCLGRETEVYVDWRTDLGNDSPIRGRPYKVVRYRFDDETGYEAPWSLSETRQATFSPEPIVFLKKVADSARLTAETVPYRKSAVLASFDLRKSWEAVDRLAKACNWRRWP